MCECLCVFDTLMQTKNLNCDDADLGESEPGKTRHYCNVRPSVALVYNEIGREKLISVHIKYENVNIIFII